MIAFLHGIAQGGENKIPALARRSVWGHARRSARIDQSNDWGIGAL